MAIDSVEEFVEKCPQCGAEYELVKTLKPHPFHTVPVFRLKETSETGTNEPSVFLTGGSPKDVEEYLKILTKNQK